MGKVDVDSLLSQVVMEGVFISSFNRNLNTPVFPEASESLETFVRHGRAGIDLWVISDESRIFLGATALAAKCGYSFR